MLFLKKILARWIDDGREAYKEAYADPDRVYPAPMNRRQGSAKSLSGGEGIGDDFKDPMNITLYNAVGGRIVKFQHYDRAAGHTNETTYIISSEEDFESALGKFIAVEAIKHT